jgi:hypothetical protein
MAVVTPWSPDFRNPEKTRLSDFVTFRVKTIRARSLI